LIVGGKALWRIMRIAAASPVSRRQFLEVENQQSTS